MSDETRRCSVCLREKTEAEMERGRTGRCLDCVSDLRAVQRAIPRGATAVLRKIIDRERSRAAPEGFRLCPRCREAKRLELFTLNSSLPSGRDAYCAECRAELAHAYYHARKPRKRRRPEAAR